MAYENGRRINGYFNMRKGKFLNRRRSKTNPFAYRDKPWKYANITGPRTVAKKSTNRKLRHTDDIGNHSGYRKVFNYSNTIW